MNSSGLTYDFVRGRTYERREMLAFVAALLQIENEAEKGSLLRSWAIEAAESLELPKTQTVVIEDTYLIL